jgi:hypothetical protein
MIYFVHGFGSELLKIAGQAMPQIAKQQMGGQAGQNSEQKLDPSPVASADRNTGTNTPAGQPELPRGNPASTDMGPLTQPKRQSFKAAKT